MPVPVMENCVSVKPEESQPMVRQEHRSEITHYKPLNPDDERLHPLMRHALRGYLTPSSWRRGMSGLRVPLKAATFLIKNPALWPWAIAPALINFAIFVSSLFFSLPAASQTFGSLWAMPEIVAWYHYGLIALWGVVYLLVMLLTLVLSYMVAMMIGGVIASPFNDVLSEKTEKLLLGDLYQDPQEGAPFLPSLLKSMASSAAVALLYFAIMAPMLLLHFIPGVGSIAYTLVGGLVGGYFMALEYSDTLLERRGTGFKRKLNLVWQERSYTLGFGVGTSLMLAIPLINFFCLPIAVIAGTAVGTALLEDKRDEQ